MNKRWLFLILFIVLSLLGLWWFYSNAVIEVVVENPSNSKIAYSFLNQGDQSSSQITVDESTVSQRVKKGNYEVTVTQGDTSYLTVVKAGGFLSKTKISANLVAEKYRSFVGDNPSPCTFDGDVLYSYDCRGSIIRLTKHVPATATLSTYTNKAPTRLEGTVEGFVTVGSGTVAVLHPIDVEGGGQHVAYSINNKLIPIGYVELQGAGNDIEYMATAFGSGILLSSRKYDEFLYYKGLGSPSEKIVIKNPDDKNLRPSLADNSNTSIAVLYSSVGATSEPQKPSDIKNVVSVYSAGKQTDINYDGLEVLRIKPCGSSYVCILNNKS